MLNWNKTEKGKIHRVEEIPTKILLNQGVYLTSYRKIAKSLMG